MLKYLEKSARPEIAYAVHQCARFCEKPNLIHERAVHRIGQYLFGTRKRGLVFKPDRNFGIEVFVDADFAGNWNSVEWTDPVSVLSCSGFMVRYANCPLYWSSKLQTEISLSTTEAQYIVLSQSLREVILIRPFLTVCK